MYWFAEPLKLVWKIIHVERTPGSRGSERPTGQRPTSDQWAKWMNDSFTSGRATTEVMAATSQVNRTQSAHHRGMGVTMVNGVARASARGGGARRERDGTRDR